MNYALTSITLLLLIIFLPAIHLTVYQEATF